MSEGTVITFYSYKGGVGRTFALANIAALLSTWGYRVLCIDWDLEAPGLQFYFQSRLATQDSPGLVEFIDDYAQGKQPEWRDYTASVSFNTTVPPLLFMQAGIHDESYARRLQSLNWETLYSEHGLGDFLEQVRDEWKEAFDFIFIDSRTGITDIGGICTIQLPDLLVLPLTANEQSLSGSIDIMNRLQIARADLPFDRGNILVLPVISRFEGRTEYKQGEQWLRKFAQRLAPLYKGWLHRDVPVEDILNFTRIPSIPFWSFGEELPVIEKGTDDPDDIGFSLETLAALVAQKFSFTDVLIRNREVFVSAAKSGAELLHSPAMQQSTLEKQSEQSLPVSLFISYSSSDGRFEKELETHLSILQRQKMITTWSSGQISAGTDRAQQINARLEESNLIVLLISSSYLASPASDQEMEQALKRWEAGKAKVIPIILRPVDWQASPLRSLKALPSDARPVTSWKDKDAVLADIAQGIREVVESLRKT